MCVLVECEQRVAAAEQPDGARVSAHGDGVIALAHRLRVRRRRRGLVGGAACDGHDCERAREYGRCDSHHATLSRTLGRRMRMRIHTYSDATAMSFGLTQLAAEGLTPRGFLFMALGPTGTVHLVVPERYDDVARLRVGEKLGLAWQEGEHLY